LVIFLFNRIILTLTGNVGVAAYGIIANISLVSVAIFTGIGQGLQPLASLNFGVRNDKNVFRILAYGFGLSLLVGFLLYGTGRVYADSIIQLFNSENNQLLVSITKTGLRLYFIAFLFM